MEDSHGAVKGVRLPNPIKSQPLWIQRTTRSSASATTGPLVAVGSVDSSVCVIRVADNRRYDLPGVSYDFGGNRLALDPKSGTLFSGAYYNTGVAAYEIETGNQLWRRRDLKKLQTIAHDSRDAVVYCAF